MHLSSENGYIRWVGGFAGVEWADSQALEVKYASSVKIWLLSGILQVVLRVSHAYRFSNMMLIWCFDARMASMEFDCCHSTIQDTP